MIPCYVTNIEGKRVNCQPYVRYKTEIAVLKLQEGIAMTKADELIATVAVAKMKEMGPDNSRRPLNNAGVLGFGGGGGGPLIYAAVARGDAPEVLRLLTQPLPDGRPDVNYRHGREGFGEANGWISIAVLYFLWLVPKVRKVGGTCGLPMFKHYLSIAMLVCGVWLYATNIVDPADADASLAGLGIDASGGNGANGTVLPVFPWSPATSSLLPSWATHSSNYVSEIKQKLDYYYLGIPMLVLGVQALLATAVMATVVTYDTPLTLACAMGRVDIVKALLEYNASINRAATSQIMPLEAAAAHGRRRVMRLLIERGADATHVTDAAPGVFGPWCGLSWCSPMACAVVCCHRPVQWKGPCLTDDDHHRDCMSLCTTMICLLLLPALFGFLAYNRSPCAPGSFADYSACAPGYQLIQQTQWTVHGPKVPAYMPAGMQLCVRIPKTRETWDAARRTCEADSQPGLNTSLITFDSMDQLEVVRYFMNLDHDQQGMSTLQTDCTGRLCGQIVRVDHHTFPTTAPPPNSFCDVRGPNRACWLTKCVSPLVPHTLYHLHTNGVCNRMNSLASLSRCPLAQP